MHYPSCALDWVRGALFRACTRGRHSQASSVSSAPHPQHWPSSEAATCRWLARARHAAWARDTETPARLGDLRVLVPLYVLSPEEREQALSAPAGAAREVLR